MPMSTDLPKWLDHSSHLKVEFAEFTGLCIGALDPLLEA